MLSIILAIAGSYLIGSIPTSYIIGRIVKGIDIREYGSGNIGATNLMRSVGKIPGIIALILDVGKGLLPVIFIAGLFYSEAFFISEPLFKVILGISSVCGHIWTIFLRFKGGKGVATTIGVLLGLAPIVTSIGLLIWLIVVLISRYVSLGSIIMAVSLPLLMMILRRPIEYTLLSAILCVFISYKHKQNIRRLIDGTEYKIGRKIKK
ncbi:MAG: glycerol-3-phosphate 1-O-acyltransferase PlsY [Candidatus Omnitrophica bacterium]|nr:glycerol-3-phosphate 1-O-acyltransferase PlsY [Candidatus Omnitrophota bacterium]